eukprot:scaffold17773_cov18-Prasinocladus_malaysianus.AAC.1
MVYPPNPGQNKTRDMRTAGWPMLFNKVSPNNVLFWRGLLSYVLGEPVELAKDVGRNLWQPRAGQLQVGSLLATRTPYGTSTK